MEQQNNFLHKKLPDLQKSEEVQDAVTKHTNITGEKVPNNPEARLGIYMERLENIFLNDDEETRKRNIEMLRDKIHDAFVIKPEDVPESYFELQKRVARERGQAVEEIPQETRKQMIAVIVEDQKHSLDSWIDYLSSNDAMYPTWFKYFVFRNITKLSQFDKDLGKFKERTKATTAPFPDIYREALAQVSDLYESAQRDKELFKDKDFQEFLAKKFPTQYADKIQQTLEHSQEAKEQIAGEWIKYTQGDENEAIKLYKSLENKGTGWCTAGMSTAETQIESGDFYVYYSYDKENKPTQPRLAIRMEGKNRIGEVRGVLPHQEVESTLQEILDTKLSSFGDEAKSYKKKSSDMRRLTTIEKTTRTSGVVTKEDLLFLYEIEEGIEGFGYKKDPRIASLIKERNLHDDFKLMFNFEPIIATTADSIDEETNVLSMGGYIYLKNNKNHTQKFQDTARYNSFVKKLSANGEVTRADLIFINEVASYIQSFEGLDKKNSNIYKLKIQINQDQYLKKALGLEEDQLAHNLDEITERTVLYIPEIRAFLSDDTTRSEDETKNKLIYDTKLNNEKIIRRISKKIDAGEDLNTEEVQFVFRDNTHFELPYGSQKEPLNGEAFRDKVSRENIEKLFGKDLAEALEKVPAILSDWGYYGGNRNENRYIPYLGIKDGGESFLMCATVGVEELGDLAWIDEKLRKSGYKFASGKELESFLKNSDLFLSTNEREVYGSGYIWKKYLTGEVKGVVDQKIGHLLSLDNERLQSESFIISSKQRINDEGYPETQRALIAITKATEDGLGKYDIRESDDELYKLQDKLVRK